MNTQNNALDENFFSILDDYSGFVKKKEETKVREKEEKLDFVNQFIRIRDTVIKPIFENLKEEAQNRHFTTEIELNEDPEKTGGIKEVYITMFMQLETSDVLNVSHYDDPNQRPHLSFFCDYNTKKIRVHQSTIGPGHGGHYGWKNEYEIYQIDQSTVKKELLDWVSDLIREATFYSN